MKRLTRVAVTTAILAAVAACAVAPDHLGNAIADPTRLADHVARDSARQPATVLKFSGVARGDRVADLAAGSGYYTALLSRVVGTGGKVYAVGAQRVVEKFDHIAALYPDYIERDPRHNVEYSVQKFDALSFPEPLDSVVMGLYYHDTVWSGVDRAAMNRAIIEALKPGGTYLVIDHAADETADLSVARTLHRMPGPLARAEIEAAGFDFVGKIDVLAQGGDDRARSIFDEDLRGQTNRFVYLFRKP